MKKRELLKTGIDALDLALGGGIPLKRCLLVVGVPGSGKTSFCTQFIYEGLKRGEPGIYITYDMSPEMIKESMEVFGWNIEKYKKLLRFIDCYSWKIGKVTGEEGVYLITTPADLNEINITLRQVIQELKLEFGENLKVRIVIDSVSSLLMIIPNPIKVVKFIQHLTAEIRNYNGVGLFVLEEGVHEKETLMALDMAADGVIEFKFKDDHRIFRISRLFGTTHSREWIKFEIGKGGIVVKK